MPRERATARPPPPPLPTVPTPSKISVCAVIRRPVYALPLPFTSPPLSFVCTRDKANVSLCLDVLRRNRDEPTRYVTRERSGSSYSRAIAMMATRLST